MPTGSMKCAIHQLREVLLRDVQDLADSQLLDSFVATRDEVAFEMIVRRHGSMVLGVCRRILGNDHDAEDAFQAVFLVFARKAASISRRELLANWLYGVAHRTSLAAKGKMVRRRSHEIQVKDMPQPVAQDPSPCDDWLPLLDAELSSLPDKYRIPILLCDLQGRTRQEAARQLKIPEGTLSSRLATARKRLADRLTRRGIVLSGGALAASMAQSVSSAAIPAVLMTDTVKTATTFAAGNSLAVGGVSESVAALAEGVLKSMLLSKLKFGALLLLGVVCLATGTGWLSAYIGMLDTKPVDQNQPEVRDVRVAANGKNRGDVATGKRPEHDNIAADQIKAEKFTGRVVAVSKDAKSFTFEGTASDRPAKLVTFEVKIGEKTAITYDAVATGGTKPTVGYAVGVWMDDTVKGLATRVGFGGTEGRGADINGLVVDLDKDGKGITLLSPLGGVVDGGAKPKNVNVRFNEKTVFDFSSVREGEARIEKNQSAHVWYDDDARVSGQRIAGQVRFSGSASVSSSRQSDISGKLLSIDDTTLTIEQRAEARGEKPKKVILKIGAKSSIVYDNVRPGGAKPTAGQGVSVWLKGGSKDTATDIALSGNAPERWVMINGTVVDISDDRATITLERPSAVRGEKPKQIEIKLTARTRFAYGNVGPDGAKLTVGYMAWVRLFDGSKDTAAQVTFERRTTR